MRAIICISSVLISISTVIFAQEPESSDPDYLKNIPAKYDLNGDGLINEGTELNIYLTHQENAILAKHDTNIDGILSASEIKSLNDTFLNDEVRDEILDAGNILGERSGFSVAEATKPRVGLNDNPCNTDSSATLIRAAYFTPSVFTAFPKKDSDSLRTVAPANFSFTRNNLTESNVFAASGAISFVGLQSYKNCDEQSVGALQERAYSAGIVFDLTDSSDPDAQEVDSLAFNLNGDFHLQGWPLFNSQYITGSSSLISDFGFDSAVLSTSLNWQPFHNPAAIGVARKLGELPVSIRWQPDLTLDYQVILDSGERAELADENDSLFLSPSISIQLFLESEIFANTFIELNYQHLEDLLDSSRSFDFFESSLNIPLDTDNHFLFQVRYREGNLPSSRQAVDDYLLGLGVRF